MRRAAGVCRRRGCLDPPIPGRAECQAHAPAPYAGHAETRRAQLPKDWPRRRRAVRRRARGRCEQCGNAAPTGIVDHRVPLALGGSSDLDNLAYLCAACGSRKTVADLAAIRRVDQSLSSRQPAIRLG